MWLYHNMLWRLSKTHTSNRGQAPFGQTEKNRLIGRVAPAADLR
jgi:hypothetical protein